MRFVGGATLNSAFVYASLLGGNMKAVEFGFHRFFYKVQFR